MRGVLFSLISLCVAMIVCFGFSCYYSYFYPLKYKDEITVNAENYGVDVSLIASIINVESSYNKNSVSSRGAVGLMQVLPSTGEWVMNRLGKDFKEEDLFEPSINIQIGTYYISYLINYFGEEDLAICAYNAGMGNVKKWLSVVEYSSDGQSLQKIPYKETENYLKLVHKNRDIYKNKF